MEESSVSLPLMEIVNGTYSRPTAGWRVVLATVIRQLQITRRYLPNLLGTLVELSVRVGFFLVLANSLSLKGQETFGMAISGRNLFIFLLGSLVLFIYTRSTLWGPINAVTNDLYNGTLEYLYSSPGSRYAYYIGCVVAEVTISQVVFVPLFLLLALYSRVSLTNAGMMLLASVAVLVSLTAMGIMIALLALLWRQVGSIASVMGILFEMLAGAYLPITAFPPVIQRLAYLLPYTWGYDLIRYYSFEGRWQTICPPAWEWVIILAFAVSFTALSRYLLARAEIRAKRVGLHII